MIDLSLSWSNWMVLGMVLLVGELLTPGAFFLLFFGLGAILVGCLVATGVIAEPWLQWVLFALLSSGMLALLRSRLGSFHGDRGNADASSVVGETAIAIANIPVGGVGQGEMRGTVWSVRNLSGRPISQGEEIQVSELRELTLIIKG